jgi:murein DD-endopeptidase MepM/ murein hydrolase activator NlpD
VHPRRFLALTLLLSASLTLLAGGPWSTAAADGGPRGARAWSWPVDTSRDVARPYRAPPTPYAAGHRGIDLPTPVGATVRSPDDGVVQFAGVVGTRPVLSVRHASGIVSSFEPVDALVEAGRQVRRGDPIGTVAASSGHCPLDCLHIGARIEGRYFSPLVLLGGVPRAVLLPLEAAGDAGSQARG